MQTIHSKQEAINVVLAQLLTERGIAASPEALLRGAAVDVLVSFRGLRLAIEGEVDDQPGAAERAWKKAKERVDRAIAQVGLAVVYPSGLRAVATDRLPSALSESPLRFSFCRRPSPPVAAWQHGGLSFLRAALEEVFKRLLSEDEIKEAVRLLRECITDLASDAFSSAVAVRRVAIPLGIPSKNGEQQVHIAKIGALVIANALLFQEELAKDNEGVRHLRQCFEVDSPHDALLASWRYILANINYHAVFDVAAQILEELPADRALDEALRRCCERILQVVRMQVALEHDLTGRLYHLLLGGLAKNLGAFYTSVSAAIMLLRMALEPTRWGTRWNDVDEIARMRIGDLACGTGTLLATAVQAVVDNFVRESFRAGTAESLPDKRKRLLTALLEQGIWGLDVLASATHLTATTLALPVPEAMAKGMHLYAVDMGTRRGKLALGSLDLLSDAAIIPALSMFPRRKETRGRRATSTAPARGRLPIPEGFDLLCMNPPFARTCGDNLLFGSIPPTTRKRLQSRLSQIIRETKLKASMTAGLGSVFLALADRYLNPAGRLAFVLPKTLLSGVDWGPSRSILSDYFLETAVASHDPNRWNFSENSEYSEILLVAQKEGKSGNTLCVNLWKNSDSPLSALEVAEQLRECQAPMLREGALSLRCEGEKAGEAFLVAWEELRTQPHWMLPFAFAQSDLVRTAWDVCRGRLVMDARQYTIPLCSLLILATLGPDRRRLWATFEPTDTPPGHPAFWGHDAAEVTSLVQHPNAYLAKLARPKEKQKTDYADTLLRQSGNILIAERMWLNTQRAPTVLASERLLSNVWWPVRLRDTRSDDAAKALVLWLNSTLGLLVLFANRAETRGAWVDFKKPTLQNLPVLNLGELSPSQLKHLGEEFNRIASRELQPLSGIATDGTRKMIDDAICTLLGLPDLTPLRRQLSLEPILSLEPLGGRFLSAQ